MLGVAFAALSAFFGHEQLPLPGHDSTEVYGFQLRHVFHRNTVDQLHGRFDVSAAEAAALAEPLSAKGTFSRIPKFSPAMSLLNTDPDNWRDTARANSALRAEVTNWHVAEAMVPDIKDKETVVTMAKLAANAYVPTPYEGDWSNVSHRGWNIGEDGSDEDSPGFGWMEDGIRGYVFASEDNSTLVISYKGTSTAVLDNGGPTAPNDKINDNLLFSCCCARISYVWNTVCDCYLGGPGSRCDENCLEREMWRPDRYYRAALDVYTNATALYPQAKNVWLVGHSLGGVLATLIGRTFGWPVTSFEAPGEALAVKRLHLPAPPGIPLWDEHVWHFGHTADPIFIGTCNGAGSTCWLRGYAMETKCHSGQICVYDVVKDKGWYESIANHRIHVVIDDVLEAYDDVAACVLPPACSDCDDWDFEDPLDSPFSSSSLPPSGPTSRHNSKSPTSVASPTPTTATTYTSTKSRVSTTDTSCVERAWYGRCLSWTTISELPRSTPDASI